jgi:hypothetical protein
MSRLNVSIGADITELEKGWGKAIKLINDGGKEMSADIAKAAKEIQDRLTALASSKPTARVVRQLQTMAIEARAMGPEFAAMADKFVKAAGKMQDEIGDTRAEIGYFASDTRRLDAALGGAQALAAGFGVVEGSMAALGVESEDLQKTMAKLQGVMVLLNSLQTIQNALQAESAFVIGVKTAAQKIETYVMGQATVAARAYAAAVVATGAGAVLVGLGLIASLFMDIGKKTKDATKETEDFYETQKKKAKEVADAMRGFDDEVIAKAVTNAKRKGLTDKGLRDAEIKAIDAAIAARTKQLNEEEKYSARWIEINNNITTLSKRKEDLITENIVAANKQREEIQKAAAEKEKQRFQETVDFASKVYQQFGIKAYSAVIDGFGQAASTTPMKPETVKSMGLQITNSLQQVEKEVSKKPIEIKIQTQTEFSSFIKDLENMRNAIDSAFESLIEDTLTSLGEAIGEMIAGEEEAFQKFGKAALASIAQFMKAFGSALITTAIASDAFQKLILANPMAAAAAGVALVAGSAIITAQLKKGPEFEKFADGGIVYGPTLGLMGEYPGARSNPEVIAPLDKLRDLITPSGGDGGFIASTHISGRDLAIVLNRHNNDYSRG